MTLFYLVRHGETQWNRERVFRGRIDVPLNDSGREQAGAVADRLSEAGLAAVYASPLVRAAETARIVADRCGLRVQTDEGFIDMDFGDWQGLTQQQVQAQFPEAHRTWQTHPGAAAIPGGEPLAGVLKRASSAVSRLAKQHPESAVCVVSHRVVLKLVMAWALGLDEGAFWRIRQDTGCINVVELVGDVPTVHTLNDTCHLVGLAAAQKPPDF